LPHEAYKGKEKTKDKTKKMETIDIHGGENGITFFSLMVDGREVGRMLINVTSGILTAGHTSVDISQRHSGYGRKLVNAVVNYARKNNLKVLPECGFVAMMFNKYPALYGDVRAKR
jgi:predicted GNAT family acetyltransferase